jgi:predicted nucleotidyltransferase
MLTLLVQCTEYGLFCRGQNMIDLVTQKKQELIELCRRFQVERLDLFGSAALDSFQSESSDLDFIVSFGRIKPGTYLDLYLDFAEALESLFQRPVDLLTEKAIRNPYFRRSVALSRQPLYERRNEEAAA